MNLIARYCLIVSILLVFSGCAPPPVDYENPRKVDLITLMKELRDPSCENHKLAMQAIAKLGPDAVQPLMSSLSNEDNQVRRDAAYTLGEIGPDAAEAIPLLADAVRNDSPIAQTSAEALGRIGKEAIPEIKELLGSNVYVHREMAAKALRYIGPDAIDYAEKIAKLLRDTTIRTDLAYSLASMGPDVLPILLQKMHDSYPDIRVGAIEAIGYMGKDAASTEPVLIDALSDIYPQARATAAFSLAYVCPDSRKATVAIAKLLSDEEYSVAGDAGHALAKFGDVAVPVLADALGSSNSEVRYHALVALVFSEADITPAKPRIMKFLNDSSPDMRVWAAWAIRDMGCAGLDAVPVLKKRLKDSEPKVRSAAIDALEGLEVRDDDTLNLLFGLFRDADRDVRESAAGAVVRFGPKVLPGLIDMLDAKNKKIVRATAAFALERMAVDASPAFPALCRMANDKDSDIRASAVLALQRVAPNSPETARIFMDLMNDEDTGIRLMAIQALNTMDGEQLKGYVDELLLVLDDVDWGIKIEIINALGKVGPDASDALPVLKQLRTTTFDKYYIKTIDAAVASIKGERNGS